MYLLVCGQVSSPDSLGPSLTYTVYTVWHTLNKLPILRIMMIYYVSGKGVIRKTPYF